MAASHWINAARSVGPGHARLSIIDLEGGTQPLCNEDESVHAVVNGEFYDFERIRTELERKGHRFKTRSDSEILLHLYEEMGTACVEQLRGEFAFALYDAKTDILLVGRTASASSRWSSLASVGFSSARLAARRQPQRRVDEPRVWNDERSLTKMDMRKSRRCSRTRSTGVPRVESQSGGVVTASLSQDHKRSKSEQLLWAVGSELFRHPDESCKGVGSHLAHDVPAVNLNRVLGDSESCRNLFVQQAADQQW